MVSEGPPGAKGIINSILFVGKSDALAISPNPIRNMGTRKRNILLSIFPVIPSSSFLLLILKDHSVMPG
jgi:hypothetical protein